MRRLGPLRLPSMAQLSLTLCAALAFTSESLAQSAQRPDDFPVGTDSFRWLLKNANLDPVSDSGNLYANPRRSILIVFGGIDKLQERFTNGFADFVERGGAILAASDQPCDRTLPKLAGVRIPAEQIEDDQHPDTKRCHFGQTVRPFVLTGEERFSDGSENPFLNLKVATNIPSYLIHDPALPAGIIPLARFASDVSRKTSSKGDTLDRVHRELLFAVGGNRGAGRVLVLADHSIFINEMMLADECENLAFAQRCLEWLKGDGQRTRAMLVVDGQTFLSFDVKLKRLPTPPPFQVLEQILAHRDEIADEAQARIARSEWEDGINKAIVKALNGNGEEDPARIGRYALWALGSSLAVFFVHRLSSGARYFPEAKLPLLTTAVAAQRPTGSVAEQRQRGQIAAGNLWESARDLARQRFASLSSSDKAPTPPPIVGSGLWRRRSARRRLQRLWVIAYGQAGVRIPPKQWEKFIADLEAFDRDVADGRVKMSTV
jgi:hypothetical protein